MEINQQTSTSNNKPSAKKRVIIMTIITVVLIGIAGALLVRGDQLVTFLGLAPGAIPAEGSGVKMEVFTEANLADGLLANEDLMVDVLVSPLGDPEVDIPITTSSSVITFPNDKLKVLHLLPAGGILPDNYFDIGIEAITPDQTDAYAALVQEANATGTINLNVARGVNTQDGPYANLAKIIFQPIAEGQVDIAIQDEAGRDAGPSLVLAEDDQGNPHDVLDETQNLSFAVRSAAPYVETHNEKFLPRYISPDANAPTPVVVSGRYFGSQAKVQLFDLAGTLKATVNAKYVSSNGRKLVFDFPTNLTGAHRVRVSNGSVKQSNADQCCINVQAAPSIEAVPALSGVSPADFVQPQTENTQFTITGQQLNYDRYSVPQYIHLMGDGGVHALRNNGVVQEGTEITTNMLVSDFGNEKLDVGVYDLQVISYGGYSAVLEDIVTVAVDKTIQVTEFAPQGEAVNYAGTIPFEVYLESQATDFEEISLSLTDGTNATDLSVSEITSEVPGFATVIGEIPNGLALGDYTLNITSGIATGTLENAFQVIQPVPPSIYSMSPSSLSVGYAAPVNVTLTGDRFGAESSKFEITNADGAVVATIGNTLIAEDVASATGTLDVSLPAGSYGIKLTRSDGLIEQKDNVFSVNPAPSISGLTPSTVFEDELAGKEFTLQGSDFRSPSVVVSRGETEFGTTLVSSSETSIVFTVNDALAGTRQYGVRVTNSDGQTATFDGLTVAERPLPAANNLDPREIDEANTGNTAFTVSGSNFYADSQLRLVSNGTTVAELEDETVAADQKSIKGTLTTFVAPGTYVVEVYSGAEGHTTAAQQALTVNESPVTVNAPQLQSHSDGSKSKTLEASWSAPSSGDTPDFYQYRISRNGAVIRDWEEDRIFNATSFQTQDFNLSNGEKYEIQIRSAVEDGSAYVSSEPVSSGEFVIRSANVDRDTSENINFSDFLQILRNWGSTDRRHEDINQDGRVNFGDIGEWSSQR